MPPSLVSLAWRQHGAFSTGQADAVGVSRTTLSRLCRAGTIARHAPAVYALTCAPATARQTLMVHVLAAGPGARATSISALEAWCPEIEPPARPVVAVPRACGYRTGHARLIRSSDLDLAKPGEVDGIPVVGVARALLDASADRSVDSVVGLIDSCQRHLTLSIGALVEALHTHQRSGRRGITTYRQALVARTAEVPDSEFERLVVRDLARAGVEAPRLHHVVRLPENGPIELDLDWAGLKLDVELDGRDHTTRMRTARRDRQRDRALLAAGYVVPRYTWCDYLADGSGMISEIAGFVAQRSAMFSGRGATGG